MWAAEGAKGQSAGAGELEEPGAHLGLSDGRADLSCRVGVEEGHRPAPGSCAEERPGAKIRAGMEGRSHRGEKLGSGNRLRIRCGSDNTCALAGGGDWEGQRLDSWEQGSLKWCCWEFKERRRVGLGECLQLASGQQVLVIKPR